MLPAPSAMLAGGSGTEGGQARRTGGGKGTRESFDGDLGTCCLCYTLLLPVPCHTSLGEKSVRPDIGWLLKFLGARLLCFVLGLLVLVSLSLSLLDSFLFLWGLPSCGGDVAVYVFDISQPS